MTPLGAGAPGRDMADKCKRCGGELGPAGDYIDKLCAECVYSRLDK
jgi:hypothetical protein